MCFSCLFVFVFLFFAVFFFFFFFFFFLLLLLFFVVVFFNRKVMIPVAGTYYMRCGASTVLSTSFRKSFIAWRFKQKK